MKSVLDDLKKQKKLRPDRMMFRDEAETLTAKNYWPVPTYGDILFSVK